MTEGLTHRIVEEVRAIRQDARTRVTPESAPAATPSLPRFAARTGARNRAGQKMAFVLRLILSGSLGLLGLYALHRAPALGLDNAWLDAIFRPLMYMLYTAAGVMMTLVHVTLVSPVRKMTLPYHLWIAPLAYGAFGLFIICCLSGFTTFSTAFPMVCFLVILIIISILHAFLKEQNDLLKQKIGKAMTIIILESLVLIFNFILTKSAFLKSLYFSFILSFYLILPFYLSSVFEKFYLYLSLLDVETHTQQERLAIEHGMEQERKRLRTELHDRILNDLAAMSFSLQSTLTQLDQDGTGIKGRLESVHDMVRELSQHLRGLIHVIDDRQPTWAGLCDHLRQWGETWLTDKTNVDKSMSSKRGLKLPSGRVRPCSRLRDRIVPQHFMSWRRNPWRTHLTVSGHRYQARSDPIPAHPDRESSSGESNVSPALS